MVVNCWSFFSFPECQGGDYKWRVAIDRKYGPSCICSGYVHFVFLLFFINVLITTEIIVILFTIDKVVYHYVDFIT